MKKKPVISTKMVFSWLIVTLPIVILIYAFVTRAAAPAKPEAVKGELDLSAWDFTRKGSVRMDGDWEFYWKQLLTPSDFDSDTTLNPTGFYTVPGIWNGYMADGKKLDGDGYATFRLDVKINDPEKLYGLKIITMSNAYILWANGERIASSGVVGIDQQTNVPEYRSQVVAFYPHSDRVRFVVQVSNFHHWKGGIWHPVKFGEYASVIKERDTRIILEIFLFGCLFIMALYHFGLFSLRANDYSTFFFGMMCLVISIRSLLTGENLATYIWPGMDWFLARKVEFILTFISVPVYSAFSRSLYPAEWPKWIFRSIAGFGIALCVFVLVTPSRIYTFSSYIFTVYSFISSLYIIYVFFRAIVRKREGAELFLASSLFFLLTIVNEILNQTEVVHTGLYLPVGLFIVVFAQSYILSSRSAHAFRTAEIYARTFQKFVPKQFLNRIAKDGIESIKPGNAEKGQVTVLFSDIRSFTSLAERMEPDEVFRMLNNYLSYVEPPIRLHYGFVDKYIGDGIMALFEKEGERSSAYNAIVAAIQMQEGLKQYNEVRAKEGKQPMLMGVGIHTGQVIIGTLGGNERMDSTAIGDAVNLCSRIEGMTKIYGAEILVSEHTIHLLDHKHEFLMRFADYVVAKGKTEPVAIWEVMGKTSEASAEKNQLVQEYEAGIYHYRNREFSDAKARFEKCLMSFPGDNLAAMYLERCNEHLENDGTTPDDFIRMEIK